MIVETILLDTGAFVMGQAGTEFARSLVPELTGGAIERGLDTPLERIGTEHNQDFMRTVAATVKRATNDLLVLPEIRDIDSLASILERQPSHA